MMQIPPTKHNTGPNALRRGRASVPWANYFVTVCVEPRLPVLLSTLADKITDECHLLTADSAWSLRCMTIMPDHLHLLFTLGTRLSLSQAIARLKAKTRASVRLKNVKWQDNFYDHQLRPADSVESVIRYIWINPYAADLIHPPKAWPYFYCRNEDWNWFEALTEDGRPFPEWLR